MAKIIKILNSLIFLSKSNILGFNFQMLAYLFLNNKTINKKSILN